VTHLTTIVVLYQKYHPEDCRITGRNMLVKIVQIKIHHQIKAHLLVVYTFYKRFLSIGLHKTYS
jgi:hypothetical protein